MLLKGDLPKVEPIISVGLVLPEDKQHSIIITNSKSKKNYNKVLRIAEKAHKALNCKGVTRSDFKLFQKYQIFKKMKCWSSAEVIDLWISLALFNYIP